MALVASQIVQRAAFQMRTSSTSCMKAAQEFTSNAIKMEDHAKTLEDPDMRALYEKRAEVFHEEATTCRALSLEYLAASDQIVATL